MSTGAFAYVDDRPATPEDLRLALESNRSTSQRDRYKAASARESGAFTRELMTVLAQAVEIAREGSVEPENLAAALFGPT